MDDAKRVSNPLQDTLKLSKYGSDYFDVPTVYISVVLALHCVTITSPEIGYAVNKVCQFMAQALAFHWVAIKRIPRY